MGKPHPESYYAPGNRYGMLTVLFEQSKDKRKVSNQRELFCKCDCGKIVSINATRVFSGNTKSCGCLWINSLRKHKVVGKRFGRLVALEELEPRKSVRRIRCKCDCGNETVVNVGYLVRGNIKSCGCLQKEIIKESSRKRTEDITGMVFGELTAIKKVDPYINKSKGYSTRWLFRCSCGKEIIAHKANVKKGNISSCGHLGKSIAEYNINNWLDEHLINYKKEASFDDLRNPKTDRKLFYDYQVFRNDGSFFLIEHQGVQHFYNNGKEFGKQQREGTDKMKKDYCNAKGITLYETRYDEDYIAKLEEIIGKELGQEGVAYVEGVKCG